MRILKTYYFDCWNRTGVMHTKKIFAENVRDAKLLFEAKYPDYAYDDPYE